MPKLTVVILLMLVFSSRPPLSVNGRRPELSALARQATSVMRAGDLPRAEALYRDGLQKARQTADWRYVSGFFTSLGVVRVNQSRYRQGLEFFLQGQDAAQQAGSPQDAALAEFNVGVIYARLGDWQKGQAAILEAAKDFAPDQLPKVLHLNLANYESRFHRYAAADRYFRIAIDLTESRGEDALVALAWEQWGLSYLERGEWDAAELCLLESYRRHRLAKRSDAEQVHYGLARLALAKRKVPEARARAAQYLRAARSKPLYYPLWEAYRLSAEIEETAGNLEAAYDLSIKGVDWARRTRAERLPSPQLMATAESALQSLYLGLIRVAQALHTRRAAPALLLTALEAAEEGRSAVLAENSPLLTDDYWQTLDRLQRTQARRLASDTPSLAQESEQLRVQLVDLESAAGLRTPSRASHLQFISQARAALAPNQAILVFRTGNPTSYAWTLTRSRVELRTIPGENELSDQVSRFRNDTLAGKALPSEAGKSLFSEIFGEFFLSESTYQRWTLVPDGPLHQLPFAALPWPGRNSEPHLEGSYLVENRTLMLAPSVATLALDLKEEPGARSFAGIADPIYNSADPRLAPLPQRADFLGLFRKRPATGFELARLPGSQAEIDAAVRMLRPANPILLSGSQVNREAFLGLLKQPSGTLHLATHVVEAPGEPRRALIALGLNPVTRQQELVGADEISSRPKGHRGAARLVVMSGCGSGRGEVVPGVGLMSLTRAWILSGTSSVVASHWSVPDNSGRLFERFYHHAPALTSETATAFHWAIALQKAQVESIRDRIPASVWAAYFVTGRN